jgi:hypothetical protein
MYNTDIPTRAELPTSAQLLRSTAIAFVAAAGILVTIVLPSEYAIDPTGVGRMLKLTEMGEIKTQLAEEAERDRLKGSTGQPARPALNQRSSLLGSTLAALFFSPAQANERVLAQAAGRQDETIITLKPSEGVEYKLTMKEGAKVSFSWTAEGGVVNYDMHGTPTGGGKEKSYKQGRSVAGDEGVLIAEGDGGHGWFWRNRSSKDVSIRLKTNGAYAEIKRMI